MLNVFAKIHLGLRKYSDSDRQMTLDTDNSKWKLTSDFITTKSNRKKDEYVKR